MCNKTSKRSTYVNNHLTMLRVAKLPGKKLKFSTNSVTLVEQNSATMPLFLQIIKYFNKCLHIFYSYKTITYSLK